MQTQTVKTLISPIILAHLEERINSYVGQYNRYRKVTKVNPHLYIDTISDEDFTFDELCLEFLEGKSNTINFATGKLILTNENQNHQVHYYFDVASLLGRTCSLFERNGVNWTIQFDIKDDPKLEILFNICHKCTELNEITVVNVIGRFSETFYQLFWKLVK